MLPKLLKLNAHEAIISGATATRSSGSVTRRKIDQPPPPSTFAASVSSVGIDWSAPIETRKKYGVVSQTLAAAKEARGQFASDKQGIGTFHRLFTTPKSSFRRPAQTSSER